MRALLYLSKHLPRQYGEYCHALIQPQNRRTCVALSNHGFILRPQKPLRLNSSPGYTTQNLDVTRHEDSTIYALSTAPGKAAIAVIRISGPACLQIYQALCPTKALPKPRHATLRRLYTPHLPPSPTTVLDSGALILYFAAPNTVTGEDVLELHVHGGPAIVRAVLAAIPQSTNPPKSLHNPTRIRYAEAGEFTRRAFANGRMDLPQIEALGDTLSASTEQQRQLSVRGTTSSLAVRYESWRRLLLLARGELEALIDFAEDQHFDEAPAMLCASVAGQIKRLRRQIEAHRANAVRGELLRSGISVALLGAPNAGKSSLLNRIVGREAAIVSREAGTTRDVVEVGVDLGGWLVRIGDMAGLRRAGLSGVGGPVGGGAVGVVEQEGIKRAKQRALESDVLIVVQDAAEDIDPEVKATAKECIDLGISVVVAINKVDTLPNAAASTAHWNEVIQSQLDVAADRIFFISCREAVASNAGSSEFDPGNIQSFLQGLMSTFKSMTSALVPDSDPDDDAPPDTSVWQESLGATERQRVLLSECLDHLDAFLASVGVEDLSPHEPQPSAQDAVWQDKDTLGIEEASDKAMELDIVIAAESLRAAADSMARITGRGDAGDVEEVLGVVFEK